MYNKKINWNTVLVLPFLALVLNACSNDESNDPKENEPVKVFFESEVSEPGGDITSYDVIIKFSSNTVQSGTLKVGMAGKMSYGTNFYTEPAAINNEVQLNLAKGQGSVKFTVHKLEDLDLDDNVIQFMLKDPSTGYQLGDPAMSLLRFRKTTPAFSYIQFKMATSELWEDDSDGISLDLELSDPVSTTEMVTIKFQSSEHLVYGEDYTTEPSLVLGEMKLEVLPGEETVSFKVLPIDNNELATNYQIQLAIIATTGYMVKGDQAELVIAFMEDDDPSGIQIHSIQELRQRFNDFPGDWYLPQDYFIEGVVTSASNVTDGKSAYLQDDSAGILLRFTQDHFLKYGDKVRINLKNGTGQEINAQRAINGVADTMGTLLDEDIVVNPEEITLEQFLSGEFEGRRVKVNGVSFNDANGTATFEGNRIISDGTFSAIVKTYANADFNTAVLPQGNIAIIGIIGDFGYLQPQQLPADIQL